LLNEEVIEVYPYEMLAHFYDELMIHVNYKKWAQYIDEIIKSQNISNARILDISCGTGTLLIFLYKKGYKVSGSDISKNMINTAISKIRNLGYDINFFQTDMRKLSLKKKFNVIVCLYDSINYILTCKEFINTLNNVYFSLSDNGIFIFDVCTEYNSIKNFYDYYDSGETADFFYQRHSFFIKEDMLQINTFRILSKKNNKMYLENHKQRIYTTDELNSIISKTEFTTIGMFDNYSFNPPGIKSERIHFVLRKKI